MAHEETVMEFMNQVVICDKHIGGDYMAHKGFWTKGTSSVNNFYKGGCTLTDAGRLEKGDGFFRLPGCKSEYKEHAQLLTKSLASIIKLNYQTKIFREHTIAEKGLRPDSLILLTKDNQALCFCLEVCNNEFPEFLQQKINTWNSWEESKDYLSQLFKTKIKEIDFVVSGDITADGTFNLQSFLKEIENA
jgi:hypothetical protein